MFTTPQERRGKHLGVCGWEDAVDGKTAWIVIYVLLLIPLEEVLGKCAPTQVDGDVGPALNPSEVCSQEPIYDAHESHCDGLGQDCFEPAFNIIGEAKMYEIIHIETYHDRFIGWVGRIVLRGWNTGEETRVVGQLLKSHSEEDATCHVVPVFG